MSEKHEGYDFEFYNEEHNLVFYNIPKCSMTSILGAVNFKMKLLSEIPSDAVHFCVLRDPLERFASTFFQIRSHQRNEYLYYSDKIRMNDQIVREVFDQRESLEQQFFNYINSIVQCGYWENHNASQMNYISGKVPHHKNRRFDKLTHFLQFENLNEDFKKKILNIELPHLNKKSKDSKYKDLIDQFKVEINDLYSQDIDLYNQTFQSE